MTTDSSASDPRSDAVSEVASTKGELGHGVPRTQLPEGAALRAAAKPVAEAGQHEPQPIATYDDLYEGDAGDHAGDAEVVP